VQRARDQALAGAGLAEDDDRRRRVGDAPDALAHRLDRGAVPDDARLGELRAQRGLERHRLAPHAHLVERAPEEDRKLVLLERLGQVVVRALADRLDRGVDRAVGGHDDHRAIGVHTARRRQQLEPVDLGHAQVGDDGVEAIARRRQPLHRLGARRQRHGVVAAIGEPVGDGARHLQIVVDDQNARALARHASRPPPAAGGSRRACRAARRA
jgi:hypothetical protein